jgi:hypothetical protein
MALIGHLDSLLPGIRLQERLLGVTPLTHQGIANYLAQHGLGTYFNFVYPEKRHDLTGLLNHRVLNALRHTDICVLSLTASLVPENGLNISGSEVLRGKLPSSILMAAAVSFAQCKLLCSLVFTRPHSFRHLSELSLSDTPLDDYDLAHIHHLPNLSILHLSNTGIGNEASASTLVLIWVRLLTHFFAE